MKYWRKWLSHIEKLLQALELPYRILRLCGGDMSFASALTYDFEVYSAAQQKWLEVSSVSNFENFQTNRLKIRFKDADSKTQLATFVKRLIAGTAKDCGLPAGK